jgi:hypothetical protein
MAKSAAAAVQIGKTPEQPYRLIYSRAEFAAATRWMEKPLTSLINHIGS